MLNLVYNGRNKIIYCVFEIIFIYIKVGSVGRIIDFGYKWSVYCKKNFKFINNFVCLFLIIYSSYI